MTNNDSMRETSEKRIKRPDMKSGMMLKMLLGKKDSLNKIVKMN